MKRGQLAAVLIIVLLVAAIGGFVVFSQKKAGKATFTLSATQTRAEYYSAGDLRCAASHNL